MMDKSVDISMSLSMSAKTVTCKCLLNIIDVRYVTLEWQKAIGCLIRWNDNYSRLRQYLEYNRYM